MMKNIALAMASALALSACANYPKLVQFDAPLPVLANNPTELEQILNAAASLQASYSRGYKTTAKWTDIAQLPMIAAAAAAAWVLLDGKANAARDVGRIGIGAGAYSAARGQLMAAGLTDAYIAGHGALTCVLAEGSIFAGSKADERSRELNSELQKIANAIALVSTLRWQPDAVASPETLKTVRMVADQAIANARTAEAAALAQLGAFNSSAPVFRNAVSSISVRVASKGRVRPAIDFATLRDSFAPPKTGNADAGESLIGPRFSTSTAPLVDRLVAATAALATATARLSAGTPGYTQSLTRVSACPDLVK